MKSILGPQKPLVSTLRHYDLLLHPLHNHGRFVRIDVENCQASTASRPANYEVEH